MKTYTVTEAAQLVHCHPETLREYIRTGKLVAVKIGRSYCIRQVKLDEFLINLENNTIWRTQSCPDEKTPKVSTNETVFGTLTSQRRAAKELDNLLKPKTKGKPKSCMTN